MIYFKNFDVVSLFNSPTPEKHKRIRREVFLNKGYKYNVQNKKYSLKTPDIVILHCLLINLRKKGLSTG